MRMILNKFNLKGKCGLVTGAGSGIGKGMATGLAEAGAKVALAGRNMEKLEKATAEMMAMVGDNQTFSDMDVIDVDLLK
jgi:NADP-dependent 3-hydroxy acid dehydrogenase YdfG